MNNAVMFGKVSDQWETPDATYAALHAEFDFRIDLAATEENKKCAIYIGPGQPFGVENALVVPWADIARGAACWLNPPYSKCREFIAKAAQEARRGCTVVALVPSRTDTRWWHAHVWDASTNTCRPGVEIRFIKGRLKFGNSENSAPFPSVIIIFRPVTETA